MPDTVHPEIIDSRLPNRRRAQLEPALVCAIIEQESAWNPWAVRYEPEFCHRHVAPLYTTGKLSATETYMCAMSWGLMQVMGQVARNSASRKTSLAELCEPAAGVEFGLPRPRRAHRGKRAKGDVAVALQAWNGGAADLNYAARTGPKTCKQLLARPVA